MSKVSKWKKRAAIKKYFKKDCNWWWNCRFMYNLETVMSECNLVGSKKLFRKWECKNLVWIQCWLHFLTYGYPSSWIRAQKIDCMSKQLILKKVIKRLSLWVYYVTSELQESGSWNLIHYTYTFFNNCLRVSGKRRDRHFIPQTLIPWFSADWLLLHELRIALKEWHKLFLQSNRLLWENWRLYRKNLLLYEGCRHCAKMGGVKGSDEHTCRAMSFS